MSTAIVHSRASSGIAAPPVSVEVHLSNGLPGFTIVGLPETSVRDARERVRSALLNSFFEWPDRRITVSLAPADLPKGGGRFDLPIALGILIVSGQLKAKVTENAEFYGELGLDGSIRPCVGLMSAVTATTAEQRLCVVGEQQAATLATVAGARILGTPNLLTLCGQLKNPPLALAHPETRSGDQVVAPDIATINGQTQAKRVLEIAAAGGHHLLMIGPPGAGKTLLASALGGLLPAPEPQQRLETLLIRDLLGLPTEHGRPFRTPHHSASDAALIGGGAKALPGEISLAHGGTLFLDEIAEFPRRTLDMLRQPLESGTITISRARGVYRYPAQFQLVAAMNPCPCGQAGGAKSECRCSRDSVLRYQARLSGPLLDRIDLHTTLERQSTAALFENNGTSDTSAGVRMRVSLCHKRQRDRQGGLNSALSGKAILEVCQLDREVQRWFESAADRLKLSARSVHRGLRVARTIADLKGEDVVTQPALLEALGYRPRLGE